MIGDVQFFDDVFVDGAITEQRIDAACVKIMQVGQFSLEEAKKADLLLKDILLLGIANRMVEDPQRCLEHDLSIGRAAFGRATALDELKRRVDEGAS